MFDTATIIACVSIVIAAATFILHFMSSRSVINAKTAEDIRKEVLSGELASQLKIKLQDTNDKIGINTVEIKTLAAKISDHSIMISVIEERLKNEIFILARLEDKLDELSKAV